MSEPDAPPDINLPAPEEGPLPLEEYEYYVGHMKMTALLTPEMAERLQAVPVGTEQDPPTPGQVPNNEAQRMSTANRAADDSGVVGGEDVAKARTARNKRA